jgi:hypothetical protein
MRQFGLLSALVVLVCSNPSSAEKLSDWQRVPFDNDGASVLVQLYQVSGQPVPAYFGYRCYNDQDKFGLGNAAFFVKLDNVEMACLKNPVQNVTLLIDGKSYPQVYQCDEKRLGGALYFEWGSESRADLNNMYDLDVAIDKSKSKEVLVTITDKNHFMFKGSLKNASIRKKLMNACAPKR